ncbi:MAG: hypothetical protein II816_04405, partial [Elusimicrobia bacterium]|nr:hypothetical protein [Elusimicrobiota bacterium]
MEKSVIKRVSKNFINSETKTVQDKYFAEDIFLHKKNIWKFLINDFQSKNDTKYANTVTRNIYFINYKKQAVFNELSNKEKELFKDIISTDEKAVRFFARRAKQLFEEKNNISLLLNDISAKKKELYAFINSNANSQKKKNLQKELDKIKEKEKALRLESAECSKDLAELELIKENLLVYNEINILEIKDYIFAESLEINKSLGVVNEYIKFFMEKQKSLLNSLQENLKNVNMFDYTELKKCGNNLLICDENFSNMVQQQTFFNEQQNFLISNYTNLLLEIKKYIDGADVADGDEFFNKLKSFIDKEINIFSAKEKVLNKSFEYDKIYKLQNDIFFSDLTAKRKIDALGNLLETKNAIKGLFPKEQEPKKVKSKKRQEKT